MEYERDWSIESITYQRFIDLGSSGLGIKKSNGPLKAVLIGGVKLDGLVH